MIKALIRFFMLQICTFIDGLTIILFDKEEIVKNLFYTVPIQRNIADQQKILVNYLEKCRKQVSKNDKGNSKKKINTETD